MRQSISVYLAIFHRQSIQYIMSVFCLLWIPAFYFFRRSITGVKTGKGWLALLLGIAAVLARYFAGPLVNAGGLGLLRWLGVFIDIVSLPVIVPLVVVLLLVKKRVFPESMDYAGFTLLWLVPLGVYFSIDKSSLYSPLVMVLVPLLWTTQALGVSFFINCIFKYRRWYITVPSILLAAFMPLAAAASWWAFYSQQTPTGCLSLFICLIPALVSLFAEWRRGANVDAGQGVAEAMDAAAGVNVVETEDRPL
jgi:hypothetical protein